MSSMASRRSTGLTSLRTREFGLALLHESTGALLVILGIERQLIVRERGLEGTRHQLLEHGIDGKLAVGDRERRTVRQLSCHGVDRRIELGVGQAVVDETHFG